MSNTRPRFRLSQSDPALSRVAVTELAQRLAEGRAERSATWRLALKALGNTGSAKLPEMLAPELQDANSSVRKDAVRALRRCLEARAVLQTIYSKDPEEAVRKEAKTSLAKISRSTG